MVIIHWCALLEAIVDCKLHTLGAIRLDQTLISHGFLEMSLLLNSFGRRRFWLQQGEWPDADCPVVCFVLVFGSWGVVLGERSPGLHQGECPHVGEVREGGSQAGRKASCSGARCNSAAASEPASAEVTAPKATPKQQQQG